MISTPSGRTSNVFNSLRDVRGQLDDSSSSAGGTSNVFDSLQRQREESAQDRQRVLNETAVAILDGTLTAAADLEMALQITNGTEQEVQELVEHHRQRRADQAIVDGEAELRKRLAEQAGKFKAARKEYEDATKTMRRKQQEQLNQQGRLNSELQDIAAAKTRLLKNPSLDLRRAPVSK